jgi:hypothetical protein
LRETAPVEADILAQSHALGLSPRSDYELIFSCMSRPACDIEPIKIDGGRSTMALYTRLWAASKYDSHSIAFQQASPLTIQAALELLNTTSTPTHNEIKLAYSLWENQVQGKSVTNSAALNRHVSA